MNKYSLVLCVIVGLVSLTVAQMPPVVPTLNQVCDFQFQGTYSCPAPGYQGYNGSALFLSEQAYRSNLPDLLYNGYGCNDPTNPPSGSWFQTITTVGTGSLIADVTRLNWSVTNFTIDMLWYPTGGLNFTIQADAIVGHTYVVTHADFYSTNSIFVFTVLAIDRSVKIMYSVKEWANIVPTSVAPGFDAYAPSKPTCTNPIYPMSPSVMPTLNQVCQFTFNWTYSCSQGPKGNNAYNGSGLFLSQQALTYNSPDLFYNGYGCSDPTNPPLAGNYFQVSGNPNGASAIADVTANGWSVANFTVGELWFPTRSVQFAQTAPVVAGHTYVIQHADFSGNSGADLTNSIFIMTVVSVNSKAACTVQIAVKSWSAVANKAVSPGYNSGAPSVPTCGSSARR